MIRADGLAKQFEAVRARGVPPAVVHAVREVSFVAEDGRVTGLLGPNGAGKTTTLRMISTLVAPSAGTASVDGRDVRTDALAARARLGMLSDARGLYARLTARENITYYGELRGMPAPDIRDSITRLAGWLDLADILDRRTEGFSQGERMKVAIARILVHDPPNVVLDEPTNGLDVMTTRSLREVIRRLRDDGKCVLFSSHVMQEVSALCDEILIIARGVVVARGRAEELLAVSGRDTLEEAFVALTGMAEPA